MQFFDEIKNIFFPNLCLCCNSSITSNEKIICSSCLFELPLTNFLKNKNESVLKIFYGRIKIEQATALLFYHKKGITQKLIHKLKYKGHEEIGAYLGDWLGKDMKESKLYSDIDFIIPVPLHKNRLKKRGYNQVTKFGNKISNHLNKPYVENILIKKNTNETQTKKSRFERWKNVNELFYMDDLSIFENKHVLLIDDIITTGATIESCVNELFKTKSIQISVAVMAITE